MDRSKIRFLALSLAAFTIIAGLAAYFTSLDSVTNSFSAATLSIRLEEPHWKDDPTIVPEQKIDKDPYIVNTDTTPAYVFMQVTVPAQEVTVENASGDDKGKSLGVHAVPLFRFIDKDGNYTQDPLSSEQCRNDGWYLVSTTDNKNADKKAESYTYLYAWTNSSDKTVDIMSPLQPNDRTGTLFDQVIFCNAREDEKLAGKLQNISVEVFGIQTEHLKAANETETQAEKVWAYLSK